MQTIHTGQTNFSLLPFLQQGTSMPSFPALAIIPIIYIGFFWWVPQAFPGEFSESEIETLDVVEVTGTAVTKAPRTLTFPLPISHPWPATTFHPLALPDLHVVHLSQPAIPRILQDQTGKTRGRFTSVKPLKTERPLYPRMAREQGWHGKVVLRARITAEGTVEDVAVQESSEYPILDDSAVQAVKGWSFEPAKNGEFAVASTVALPIRFDLLQ